MTRTTNHSFLTRISSTLMLLVLALMVGLSACNVPTNPPALAPTATQSAVNPTAAVNTAALTSTETAPVQPTEAAPTQTAPTQATASESTTASTGQSAVSVTVQFNDVAQGINTQVVEAVTAGASTPANQVMPQYTVATLQGYPVTNHQQAPQILVFPVEGLSVNETAVSEIARVKQLLQNQPTGEAISLPYLPLEVSAKQMVHHLVKYMDFKNGKGMRYLVQWANGMVPVNNQELLYTYQGLTSDGKYYVSAVLPVMLQGLPETATDTSRLPTDFPNNYSQYLADTISLLQQNPASAYTPDLNKLDAMMQSIEVK